MFFSTALIRYSCHCYIFDPKKLTARNITTLGPFQGAYFSGCLSARPMSFYTKLALLMTSPFLTVVMEPSTHFCLLHYNHYRSHGREHTLHFLAPCHQA